MIEVAIEHMEKVIRMMETLKLGEKRAKDLGLTYRHERWAGDEWELAYRSPDIHRLLGEGVEATGHNDGANCSWWTKTDVELCKHKYLGLVVGIKAILQESEERKLLREFVATCNDIEQTANQYSRLDLSKIYDRAKALLGLTKTE